MNLDTFCTSPWRTSHQAFEESSLNIRPAPEFATAEVLLASAYRANGFDMQEGSVQQLGKDLEKRLLASAERRDNTLSLDTWRALLHGGIESPRRPQQSSGRLLSLSPLIPALSLYSGTARLTPNTWNPGALVRRMVTLGTPTEEAAGLAWSVLHVALGVSDGDDIWARWLDSEFSQLEDSREWKLTSLKEPRFEPSIPENAIVPARQFVKDLSSVAGAKPHLTRKQWTSIMEALFRVATVAHVLWLCEVWSRYWSHLQGVLAGRPAGDVAGTTKVLFGSTEAPLPFGQQALPIIRQHASRYLEARLGTNLLLWMLSRDETSFGKLSRPEAFCFLASAAEAHRDVATEFWARWEDLRQQESKRLNCTGTGIGTNLVEFCRYALGQRETADDTLRSYDQGYFLKKRAAYKSAPWVVSLGPVALLTVVHCCLAGAAGPRSVHRLKDYLNCYGIRVTADDLSGTEIGHQLRLLGLILDSPDAESGTLLRAPFETESPEDL
jgi:hypothetical protein